MASFQCERWHFRNIYLQEPNDLNPKDREFFTFARRANLDSFWCRESSTVRKKLTALGRVANTEDRFGFGPSTPPMGPFLLKDCWRMRASISILDRSLDAGTYATHVQWEAFRKNMSCITNVIRLV